MKLHFFSISSLDVQRTLLNGCTNNEEKKRFFASAKDSVQANFLASYDNKAELLSHAKPWLQIAYCKEDRHQYFQYAK